MRVQICAATRPIVFGHVDKSKAHSLLVREASFDEGAASSSGAYQHAPTVVMLSYCSCFRTSFNCRAIMFIQSNQAIDPDSLYGAREDILSNHV